MGVKKWTDKCESTTPLHDVDSTPDSPQLPDPPVERFCVDFVDLYQNPIA